MHQYQRVYGVSRVPGKGSDVMSVTPGSRHVAVMVDGQFYAFDAIRRDGSVLSVADMLVQLKAVAGMAAAAKASGHSSKAPRIGTLTSVGYGRGVRHNVAECLIVVPRHVWVWVWVCSRYDNRDTWADVRAHMMKSDRNKRSIRTIETCVTRGSLDVIPLLTGGRLRPLCATGRSL